MSDSREWPFNSRDLLRIPFIFVPHGDPYPHEWLAEHPGAIRIPARLLPRQNGASTGHPIEADWNAALAKWAVGADSVSPISDTETRGNPGAAQAGSGTPPRNQPAPIIPAAASSRVANKSRETPTDAELLKQARMRAMLRFIRWEENGSVSDETAYHARIGGHDPMSDADMRNYHPKKEWLRIGHRKLEPYTAAGAYQIVSETWKRISHITGMVDFTPENQDRAASFLINEDRATDDIETGNLSSAIAKLNHQWASLPGGSQSRTSLSLAQEKFDAFVEEELAELKGQQGNAGK